MSNPEEEYEETELQLLITLMDQAQAFSLRRLLDEQHIPSVVLGGHSVSITGCQPYQFFIDEDYFDSAQEVIESYSSPSLVTGEIEGDLLRLQNELKRFEGDGHVDSQLAAVRASMQKLQSDLHALNKELE